MSSQESSSVRTYSRAAFAAIGGDPFSREASTPSAFSTESAPEVTSYPPNRGVTRPASEAASTSAHFSEEEEDEVAASYEDL